MPNYDFKCDICGLSFEAKQDADDKQDLKCTDPNCNGFAKRQFPLGSFQLKGGGWAKDLYSKDKK